MRLIWSKETDAIPLGSQFIRFELALGTAYGLYEYRYLFAVPQKEDQMHEDIKTLGDEVARLKEALRHAKGVHTAFKDLHQEYMDYQAARIKQLGAALEKLVALYESECDDCPRPEWLSAALRSLVITTAPPEEQQSQLRARVEHLLLAGHGLMGHLSRVGYEDDPILGKTELGLLVKGFRLALEGK